LRAWRGAKAQQWARHTLAEQLSCIEDPRLRAVLGARWGDYGASPRDAPFVEHALVTGSYNGGAYYPVGGPVRFVQTLLPVIEATGGELRLGCEVKRIVVEGGRASGVEYNQAGERQRESARHVISAMGVGNTVACLEPSVAAAWQQSIGALKPGLSYVSLFLGFEGDIASAGASSANRWIYESEDVGRVWCKPADDDAPALFVSFPSLKDPISKSPPTAEVIALLDAQAFAPWLALPDDERPEDYLALKASIEERLLAQFTRHFPALQPMLRYHELSTPVTQRRYVRSPEGAMYGIEMSAGRLTSPALHVRTPLHGLLLAGQDVTSPGIEGAFMGGLLAAASIEPALWASLRT
jgi:all-trans-retinol 13,14-reductase